MMKMGQGGRANLKGDHLLRKGHARVPSEHGLGAQQREPMLPVPVHPALQVVMLIVAPLHR